MKYQIPGYDAFELRTIILDLNGTLSIGGEIPVGVKERLFQLKHKGFYILFLTGNTRNDANELAETLEIDWKLANSADEKYKIALGLDPETCVTIGNGLIDNKLMQVVKLGIVTLQAEGVQIQTLLQADIVVPSINDALDLLIDEQRLIATMRK